MFVKAYLLLPLLSAVFYALGAVCVKRAGRMGVPSARIIVLANLATAAGLSAFYPYSRFPSMPDPLWPCLAIGITFSLGQIFTVLAFARGHVSIATPALGAKVVFVAFIAATFAGTTIGRTTWLAASLVFVAMPLLAGLPTAENLRKGGLVASVVLSLLGALAFAAFDVLVQEWSGRVGFGLVVPPSMWVATVLSLPLLWIDRALPFRAAPSVRPWLYAGVGLLALQSFLLIWTIGSSGDAAGANVVYGSRGLWSVVFVFLLREMTGDSEDLHDRAVMARRLVGGLLMGLSIALVFL